MINSRLPTVIIDEIAKFGNFREQLDGVESELVGLLLYALHLTSVTTGYHSYKDKWRAQGILLCCRKMAKYFDSNNLIDTLIFELIFSVNRKHKRN